MLAEHLEENEKREKKKFMKNKLCALCFLTSLDFGALSDALSYVPVCLFSLLLFKKHIKGEKQITDWVANGSLNGGKKSVREGKKIHIRYMEKGMGGKHY